MVTYVGHLSKILRQILVSYDTLSDIKNVALDIDGVKRELLRINGSIRAVLSNIPEAKIISSDFGPLRSKFRSYLDEYDFEGELEAMHSLYSDDTMRINNVRIKILEALDDRKMMRSTRELIEEL